MIEKPEKIVFVMGEADLPTPVCADCGEQIVGQLVRFGQEPFHPECLERVRGEMAMAFSTQDDQLAMGE